MEEFSERMLVEPGRGVPRTGGSNDRAEKSMLTVLFNLNGFAIADLLLPGDYFSAQDFTLTILDALPPNLCQRK
jgi:hypothetical protein